MLMTADGLTLVALQEFDIHVRERGSDSPIIVRNAVFVRAIRNVALWLSCGCLSSGVVGANHASEKRRLQGQWLQGQWEVTELVEDGNVIRWAAIRVWLPSGGKIESNENALIFNAPGRRKNTRPAVFD